MPWIDTLVVEHASNHNCFISLPMTWSPAKLNQSLMVYEIRLPNGKMIYTSCYQYHSNNLKLKINGLFAKKLGLNHEDNVVVSEYENPVASGHEIYVSPLTCDDWEIVELNSEAVQNELLNQLRVVWVGMIFPFWVQTTTCVYFKVCKLFPDSKLCLLESRAEVVISPLNEASSWPSNSDSDQSKMNSPSVLERSISTDNSAHKGSLFEHPKLAKCPSLPDISLKKTIAAEEDNFKSLDNNFATQDNSIWATIKRLVSPHSPPKSDLSFMYRGNKPFDQSYADSVDFILRVMPVNPKLKCQYSTRSKCFNYVYISKEMLIGELGDLLEPPTSFVAVLKTTMNRKERYDQGVKALDRRKAKVEQEGIFIPQSLVVRVIIVSKEVSKKCPRNFIMCSIVLRQQLGLKSGCLVRLSSVSTDPANINQLVLHPLHPLKAKAEAVTAAFNVCILESLECNQPQLFSSGSIIEIFINDENQRCTFVVDIKSSMELDPLYSYLLQYHNLEIQVESVSTTPRHLKFPHQELKDPNEVSLRKLGAIYDYKTKCLNFLKLALGIGPLASHMNDSTLSHGHCIQEFGGLLITGPSGCGKTSLTRGLIRELHHSSSCVAYEVIECKKHQGKRSEAMKNLLSQHYCEAADCHPSIILVEDIDLLFPANNDIPAETRNSSEKMVKEFIEMITQPVSPNVRIALIATSQSTAAINSKLISSHGHFLFREIVEIKSLDKEKRREIFETLMINNAKVDISSINDVDLDLFSERTEGFVASDLQTIIDRAIHSASCRMAASNQLLLTDFDFERSLEGFESLLSSKVKVSSRGDKTLADVGGLSEVKKALHQMLIMPSQYPKLFASCPLRLRSGILLYGPPGTGKTLIAGAVAKTCNMNFISIKGPEVFSKYIGASEQLVRQLFARAESAKPCILFFDEFDSIAPRRGHNIAGVTDRVVNQLLTQMDGFEERDGVYVLAATSRPELIDPALLRPGRLDKSLYCPLPDQDERRDILKSLSRNLNFDENVDLEYIVQNTDSYSGADLHSVLGTAQINAIHDSFAQYKSNITASDKTDVLKPKGDVLYFKNTLSDPSSLDDGKHQEWMEKVNVITSKYSFFTGKTSPKKNKRHTSPPFISQQNLIDSLIKSRPSISDSDRQKYNSIYDRFGKKIPDHVEKVLSRPQRMTCA